MKRMVTISIALLFCLVHLSGMTGGRLPGVEPVVSGTSEMPETALSAFSVGGLTMAGVISLANGDFALQMGAFKKLSYAEDYRSRLEKALGLTVDVIEEEGMYKLFINSELRKSAPCLYIPVTFVQSVTRISHERRPAGTPAEIASPTSDVKVEDTLKTDIAGDNMLQEPDTSMVNAIVTEAGENNVFRRNIHNLFFLRGNSPWLRRYDYFGKSVALVNALIITIIFSFASMLILLVVILLNRSRMEKEARLRQYLMEQYQSLIVDYLFGNTDSEAFRKIASDNFRRQVLIDQMIDVSVNLKGETELKLLQLYRQLDLDSDSLARARSRKWHKKIKGFRELAFVGIKDGNEEMYKALNSRNEILRMEAQIALVRLSDENHFEFLSQMKRPFSLWEQITLHDLIIQHEIPVPQFQKWLSSDNHTVVMFALRMIREFKQTEAEPEIRKVLLHRDPRVSQLAVEVAGDLDMRTTLDTMKRMYKFQEYNNCLEIVRSMGKMPEQTMLGFLKLVLDKEDDVQLQIEAVKAIENMGEVGVQALVKVMKSEYKNYNIIVRHVLDRRIY
jgi:hypothetical protein